MGTTIYPGLQMTAKALYDLNLIANLGFTLNDVCVFIPAIFAIPSCLFTYALTTEVSGDTTAGIVAGFIMAIIPSHLMRSGGWHWWAAWGGVGRVWWVWWGVVGWGGCGAGVQGPHCYHSISLHTYFLLFLLTPTDSHRLHLPGQAHRVPPTLTLTLTVP